jgi:uncharacterized protein with PIN domain
MPLHIRDEASAELGAPLLYKGADFAQTDIASA